MNKLNRKLIKMTNSDAIAKYKRVFRENKLVAINNDRWNVPSDVDFRLYGENAKMYMKDVFYVSISNPKVEDVIAILSCPNNFVYVTKDELKEFELVTYPKLYAKWLGKQNKKLKLFALNLRSNQ